MIAFPSVRWSPARRTVVGVAAAFVGVVFVQPLAALVRVVAPETPLAPMAWSLGAVAVAVAIALALPGRRAVGAALAAAAGAAVVCGLTGSGGWVAALALAPLGVALSLAAERFGTRLPAHRPGASGHSSVGT